MTCAEAIARVLAVQGPPILFGYPGAHTVPLHAAIAREPRLRHILVRHEQAAAFAADGYARVSGRPGLFVTTAGPGATNALTAVAESYTNSVPTVHLCCLVDRPFVAKSLGAWHEADIEGIFRPVTKWRATATAAQQAPQLVHKALEEAPSGRPRPVQVCIPRDVLSEPVALGELTERARTDQTIDEQAIREAARSLVEARQPVIVAGGGSVSAAHLVRKLAALLQSGVATTCMGKGVYPDDDPLALGAVFSDAGQAALAEADVCLAIGCRFTQIATRNWTIRVPRNLIHIDIDPSVIGMHYPARTAIVGPAIQALEALMGELASTFQPDRTGWANRVRELRDCDREANSEDAIVCRLLRRAIPREAIVVGDVASLVYRMFAYFDAYEPSSFLYPAGYIAMGYGLPAAIGAAHAKSNALVVCITGDGSFSMSMMELGTAAQSGVDVKLVLLNNNSLGSIARFAGQDRADLEQVVTLKNPDFVHVARAYSMPAQSVPGHDHAALERGVAWLIHQGGPALLEVKLAAP